jgi:hypothetical protein
MYHRTFGLHPSMELAMALESWRANTTARDKR